MAYNGIIRSMKLPNSVFGNYCSWSDNSYTRNCIVEDEKSELILLFWGTRQITPIHNHGGEECWVRIIEGEFKETIYTEDKDGKLNLIRSMTSKSDDVSYMIDFMGFHRLENLSDKRSMSLHLYAKPIRSCKVFNEDSEKFINKKLAYHTAPELV